MKKPIMVKPIADGRSGLSDMMALSFEAPYGVILYMSQD